MSVSVFDEHRERWRQTWVDDAGNYFALEGNLVDGEMVLHCEELASRACSLRSSSRAAASRPPSSRLEMSARGLRAVTITDLLDAS